jgi:hypothetical protein
VLFAAHQPASWPVVWSTEAEFDLQNRLSKLPFYAPAGFGGVIEDIQALIAKAPALLSQANTILAKAGPHMDTVLKIVEDPALPQLVDRLKTMKAIQDAKPKASGAAPAPTAPGVGLKQVLPIWDAAIYVEKHPVARFVLDHPVLVGAGAALVLGGIGFGVGRLTARRRAASGGVGRRYRRR